MGRKRIFFEGRKITKHHMLQQENSVTKCTSIVKTI